MADKTVSILNVKFAHTTMDQLLKDVTNCIQEKSRTFVITANPEIVMHAQTDPLYQLILSNADYVIADGIGIILAALLLKSPLPERVPGFELMLNLLKFADEHHSRVFLLGAKEDTLEKTSRHIEERYPHCHVVGKHHGYFDWDDPSISEQIIQSKPDLIFVALGFPKQEQWIYKNIEKFNQGIFIGVGGSFDVLAGNVKRAPVIWQKLNLEWLYRLMKQPSRWKRMLALPRFVFKVLKLKFFQNQRKGRT